MIGFITLASSSIQCLVLLTFIFRISRSDTPPVLECEENQYPCREESRCISQDRVCNFVEDCLDGSDEWRCGSCRFEDEPESCGLRFRDDRVYSWYRRMVAEPLLGFGSDDEQPNHYMSLDLNIQKQKYISATGSNWHLVYKPMVLWPELRPTDSRNCRLSIRLLLTDHVSPIITKDSNTISWPQANVLISSLNGTKPLSVNLHIPKTLAGEHSSWHTFIVPIGAQQTPWTLEMIISIHVQSYLLHLSNFQFLDCRPSDQWLAGSHLTPGETPLHSQEECNSNQFKCEITGRCIDESLVCDYGYDCGPLDPSDESKCEHYQARCDFEAGDLCNWTPVTSGDAWKVYSAEEEDQMMYQIHRPTVDHTFRSKEAGHYLILNPKVLRVSEKYSLAGPRVTLRENAKECSFRLWYQVASSVGYDIVKSPHLSVGYERISAEKLFGDVNVSLGESSTDADTTPEGGFEIDNMGWRRLQVQLLNSYNIDERVLSVLEIAFGYFGEDLQYYLDRGGYLALDDFSFSLGCNVAFYGSDQEQQHCNEDQFFCLSRTPVTWATCIPIDNYCDFKNDCGLLKSWDGLSSDEIDCPPECHFLNEQHCNFKLMDARGKRMSNELSEHHAVNEAFTWSVTTDVTDGYHDNLTSPGALYISSNSANFIQNYMNTINHPPSKTLVVELDTFEVRLPVFSVSHSNCTFSLDYEWINGGNNIKAEVRLVTEHNGHRNLLKTIWNLAAKTIGSINVGLGNQKNQFSIIIAISHRQEVENLKPIKESFIMHHYKFSSCSFFPGLIEPSDEVKFINEPLVESREASVYGLDYLEDGASLSNVDKGCAAGYFQCQVPIVCIPEELVCDMQQDCQGGADEQDCAEFHQYDLNQQDKTQISLPVGWLVGDAENKSWSPNFWRLTCGLTLTRRMDDSGPPFDHSQCDYMGHYLMAGGEAKTPGQWVVSNLHSPLFRLTETPEQAQSGDLHQTGCRVVFYLYAWGKDVDTVRVLKRSFPSGKGYVIYESTGALEDRWLRNWIDLDPRMRADAGDKEFSLLFQFVSGAKGIADAIAIDDISFSPGCVMGTGNSSVALTTRLTVVKAPPAGSRDPVTPNDESAGSGGGGGGGAAELGSTSQKLGGPFRGILLFLVATCGIALIALVSFLGFNKASSIYERRKIRRRPASSRGDPAFLGAEYSLDNLDRVQLWLPSDTLN